MQREARVNVNLSPTGTLTVSGSYQEVYGMISDLKAMGFRWNPGSKVWSKERASRSEYQRVQQMVNFDEPSAKPPAFKPKDPVPALTQLFEETAKERLFGFRWKLVPKGLVLLGHPADIEDAVGSSTPLSDGSGIIFSNTLSNPRDDVAERVAYLRGQFNAITEHSNRLAVQVAKVKSNLPRNWILLDISVEYSEVDRYVRVTGNLEDFGSIVKATLPDGSMDNGTYKIPRTRVTPSALDALAKRLDRVQKQMTEPGLSPETMAELTALTSQQAIQRLIKLVVSSGAAPRVSLEQELPTLAGDRLWLGPKSALYAESDGDSIWLVSNNFDNADRSNIQTKDFKYGYGYRLPMSPEVEVLAQVAQGLPVRNLLASAH